MPGDHAECEAPNGLGGRLTFEIGSTVVIAFVRSYQPERVSVRLSLEPDANAFRLISHLEISVLSCFESETASLCRLVNKV